MPFSERVRNCFHDLNRDRLLPLKSGPPRRRKQMKVRNQDQIEKMRIAIGSAAIVAVVALTSAAAALLGLAQMA